MKKLVLGAAALSACTAAVEPGGNTSLYACEDQSTLQIAEMSDRAVVIDGEREIQLEVRPMSMARRFASNDATLILDEDRAVFVEEGMGILRQCSLSQPAELAKIEN